MPIQTFQNLEVVGGLPGIVVGAGLGGGGIPLFNGTPFLEVEAGESGSVVNFAG